MRTSTERLSRATLTVEELGVLLGVGRSAVYEMVRTNTLPIPAIRLGRRIVFSRTAVDQCLAQGVPSGQLPPPDGDGGVDAKYYRATLETIGNLCRRALERSPSE